jgi:hypothetical protein
MFVKRYSIPVTTSAGGAFTGYTDEPVMGRVLQVSYVPDGTSPLDTGADLDITGEISGAVVANHDNIGTSAFTRAYRQAKHDVAGAALLYAAGGTAQVDDIYIANERLKLVIAAGGDTKSGTFYIFVG